MGYDDMCYKEQVVELRRIIHQRDEEIAHLKTVLSGKDEQYMNLLKQTHELAQLMNRPIIMKFPVIGNAFAKESSNSPIKD